MTGIWWSMWFAGVLVVARRAREDWNDPGEDAAPVVFAAGAFLVIFSVAAALILAWG